jgi:diazepam-binding inhibitor (GABA receptor modulating acyl-CoA-binding protein)
MVPRSQFALASSIKASSFLCGGLLGYGLLYCMADVHYSWCYYAYLFCMFTFSIPPLLMLTNDAPMAPNPHRKGNSFLTNIVKSYTTPCTYEGGFPEANFGAFIMACGTAPMFFLLLIIRDLIGIHGKVELQQNFAITSVIFFIFAAAATALDVVFCGRVGPLDLKEPEDSQSASPKTRKAKRLNDAEWESDKKRRLRILVVLTFMCGLSVGMIPIVQFFDSLEMRLRFWWPLVATFGASFGLGFSRMQDVTWRVLPKNVDMANAMGFNVMCRNVGVGVGNFAFGALLDFFKVPGLTLESLTAPGRHPFTELGQVYTASGYSAMCLSCWFLNGCASLVIYHMSHLGPDPEVLQKESYRIAAEEALERRAEEVVSASERLRTQFDNAVKLINEGKPTKGQASSTEKLALYGWYKQATKGDNDTRKPWGIIYGPEQAKWARWQECRGKSKEEAMQKYVQEVANQKRAFGIVLP